MANATITTLDSSKHIAWMWQANPNPRPNSEKAEWSHFSDVENLIIEEAFLNNQPRAMLDGYYIDFKHKVKISNDDQNKQRPVERMEYDRKYKHLREERFMIDPIAPKRPFGGQYGWISPFIIQVRRDLNLRKEQLPSKDEALVSILVERAANGIIEEGNRIGKQREVEKLAKTLRKEKEKGMKEVWQCCAYLYSLESFLYKTMNEVMRLIGSEQHEQICRSKVRTLGPFCLLLWDDPFNMKIKTNMTLYRAANLTDEQFATYEQMGNRKDEYRSFQAFTSCTRNRRKAEEFGNTLFIMELLFAFTADISNLSQYPDEEEELIIPAVCFTVQSIKFDKKTNKHLINLKLRQRFNNQYENQIKSTDKQNTQPDEYDNDRRVDRIDDEDYRYACFAAAYLADVRNSLLGNVIGDDRLHGLTGTDYKDTLRRVLRDRDLSATAADHAFRIADAAADYAADYALHRYDRDRNCVG